MNALLFAIGFLTRVSVPARAFREDGAPSRSPPYYPLVGALLGAMLVGGWWLLLDTHVLLAAAVVLTAWVAITGALHLDGLADSADAWVGGHGDRARTLALMKDPRSGPMGIVAVLLVLLLKWAALASLPPAAWGGLLLAPVLGRAALTGAFLTTPYVRAVGLGTPLREAPRARGLVAVVLSAAAAAPFGLPGMVALGMAVLVFVCWRRAGIRRLGGFTGDTAGALAELVEAAVLVGWTVAAG